MRAFSGRTVLRLTHAARVKLLKKSTKIKVVAQLRRAGKGWCKTSSPDVPSRRGREGMGKKRESRMVGFGRLDGILQQCRQNEMAGNRISLLAFTAHSLSAHLSAPFASRCTYSVKLRTGPSENGCGAAAGFKGQGRMRLGEKKEKVCVLRKGDEGK